MRDTGHHFCMLWFTHVLRMDFSSTWNIFGRSFLQHVHVASLYYISTPTFVLESRLDHLFFFVFSFISQVKMRACMQLQCWYAVSPLSYFECWIRLWPSLLFISFHFGLFLFLSGCARRGPRADGAQPVGPQHYGGARRKVGSGEVAGTAATRHAQPVDVSEAQTIAFVASWNSINSGGALRCPVLSDSGVPSIVRVVRVEVPL